jgi:hypothetical protein
MRTRTDVTDGWLTRSRQTWKTRIAVFAGIVGMLCIVLPFFLARVVRVRFSDWEPLLPLFGFGLLTANFILPLFVRCRVCGVQLETSVAARGLPRDQRLRWVESLKACPVCDDDGSATLESRLRWRASGAAAEKPYWSSMRILLGVLASILLAGGGAYLGARYRVR